MSLGEAIVITLDTRHSSLKQALTRVKDEECVHWPASATNNHVHVVWACGSPRYRSVINQHNRRIILKSSQNMSVAYDLNCFYHPRPRFTGCRALAAITMHSAQRVHGILYIVFAC